MSWRRTKTPGWAAVDLKQQQKQGADDETQGDPYPPIVSNTGTWHHRRNPTTNGDLTGRSFTSKLTRSASVPNIMANEDNHSPSHVANIENIPSLLAIRDVSKPVYVGTLMKNGQSGKLTAKHRENNVSQHFKKLKELHSWANKNLIEDVMAVVAYDMDRASALLREMASPGMSGETKETRVEDNIEEVCLDRSRPANSSLHVEETTAFPNSAQVSENSRIVKNDELLGERFFTGRMVLDGNVSLGVMMDNLPSVPVEPEWEDDDDLYLTHRKEAIRATRLASRHSKAATEAYLRGDHVAAQEFSRKANEEWSNCEKLNAKAAKEILSIRNCENDDWKLDLHGLHAAEAVQVVGDHLLKMESRSTNPRKPCFTQAAAFQSVSCSETDEDRQAHSSRPRLLQVITGKGNHSRGEAALPVAIKNFLSERGYYFDDSKIGVITVQPKFRTR